MTKIKTHKGLAKVTKTRPGGSIKINKSGRNHNTGKKNGAYNRNKRQDTLMSASDIKRVKKIIK